LKPEPLGRHTTIGWAGSALILTTIVAIGAKIVGVIVAPGARGVAGEEMVNFLETSSGSLAYTLTALLVALVCSASFELARVRTLSALVRGGVVAVSGLVVALASPAVVERLSTLPSVALALVTSIIALVAGVVVVRTPQTRAVGSVLALLALCGLLRIVAWETAAVAFDRLNRSMLDVARGIATAAVALQAIAVMIAAAWVGTRSKWRGRVLANASVVVAFGVTWLAAQATDAPSAIEAVLRASLPAAAGTPPPYLLGAIAAFLVPASILLAGAALLQPGQPPAIVAPLALALLSHGAFDVPLHALLITTSAQWAMLATAGDCGDRMTLARERLPPGTRTTTESA
jgi:hypothetical protein